MQLFRHHISVSLRYQIVHYICMTATRDFLESTFFKLRTRIVAFSWILFQLHRTAGATEPIQSIINYNPSGFPTGKKNIKVARSSRNWRQDKTHTLGCQTHLKKDSIKFSSPQRHASLGGADTLSYRACNQSIDQSINHVWTKDNKNKEKNSNMRDTKIYQNR